MKTGKLILTICLGTVICIFCSGFVNAQPARGRQSNDEQTKWQKNSIADFTQQIESAYERGFKDGIAARDKFDKRKQTGKQKFNRNEKYTEGRNPKKNFRNNYNGISKKRSPSIYQWNLRQEHYQVRQDFHKPEWGFAPHRGFHEKGFHERGFHEKGFHEKGFHDKDFAQAPPKKAPRGEKGQPPQRDFRKGDKGQLAQKNVRKGDIRKGDKGQLAQRDVRKGEPRKGEPRQGELRRPPLGGKRGDIAKAKDADKKRFDKPEANKPNPNRNKRDVNKKDEDKKENQLKPSKQPKQQVPRGGRS
ncbi:MAG: hypothetical protein LBE18_02170 [Planctomycetaceae bacterium]|jgi:hypothetical protein|nr:hypothetical protein [Planctomycetaceae bacterium]